VRFWDSSAVVPLLIEQARSPRVDQWWREDSDVVLWALTPVEVTSALWRLVRGSAIEEALALHAEDRVGELVGASHQVTALDEVTQVARRLLRVHPLRAAEALQLGAAMYWAGGQPEGRIVHTLDDRLALAARREGFDVPGS
jgi:predicted nucleic acid-binding protein